MAKLKSGKFPAKGDKTGIFFCETPHMAYEIAADWIDRAEDRDAAGEWLRDLFYDGWELAGITSQENLFLFREGSAPLFISARPLSAQYVLGKPPPAHPEPSSKGVHPAVRAAALQPALNRAGGRAHSDPDIVPVGTPFGQLLIEVPPPGDPVNRWSDAAPVIPFL